jgi:hypothetical protein
MELTEREVNLLINLFDEVMELGTISLSAADYELLDKLERST